MFAIEEISKILFRILDADMEQLISIRALE